MYTENFKKDVVLFTKAFLSNQIAIVAPKLYVNLTHQTGRGNEEQENSAQIADYFFHCFQDYREQLGLDSEEFSEYLKNKHILEYGPGDILGVALLLYAFGADKMVCIDRFPLSKITDKNIRVYQHILNSLHGDARARAEQAFNETGKIQSGFNPRYIDYKVTKNGLSGDHSAYDLIISRAVLEHVNSLEATMLDIKNGLKSGGISIHEVDLKSHGLDRYTTLDFLTWPTSIYKLMYSHKGFPNRWRIDQYKKLANDSNLSIKKLIPTASAEKEKVRTIYPKVAKEFSQITPEEMSWLGFWMVLGHDA